MPAKRMVTRTVKTNVATVLCLNTITAEPFNDTVIIPNNITKEDSRMKYVRYVLDTDEVKAVQIVSINPKKMLCKMTEEFFIENSEHTDL